MHVRSLTCLSALAALAACGGPPPPGSAAVAQASAPLLGGVATNARPEIGSFSGRCTATLIAPQWALTAGHCTFYTPSPQPGDSFQITVGLDGAPHSYAVDRVHVFGALRAAGNFNDLAFEYTPDGSGTNDVAILHLSTAVPASAAVPAALAGVPPQGGATVTVFGYGCQNRDGSGGGYKQAVTYTWPSSNVLCPGDSGGPVVLGQATGAGAVVAVNTGYINGVFTSWDVHGEATYFRDEILSVIRQSEGTGALEVGYDRPGMDLASFAAPSALACQAACTDNASCRAFTYAPGGTCFLKSGVPDWTPRAGCTSGLAPQRERNVNRVGADFASVSVGSQPAEACLALCAGTAACAAYSYVQPSGGQPATCWLKSGVPGTSPLSGVTSGARRGFEPATNRAGADYADFDVPNDPAQCAARCATDANCRAFTFTAPGVFGRTSPHCWLKSAVPAPSALSGAISGVKRGLEQDTNRPGGDYADFDLPNAVPQACQARCAQDSRCQAFTYLPPGWNGASQPSPHCYLKSSVPAASSGTALVSGVRGADFF